VLQGTFSVLENVCEKEFRAKNANTITRVKCFL
jgi:hypothetical protein